MQGKLFNLEKLTNLRREFHKYPETAFNEFKTSERVIDYLQELGIEKSQMKRMAKTAVVVDIKGQAKASGNPKVICLRADMDALPMSEENPHLSYQSVNEKAAHMCGHDGHITCLLSGTAKILEHIHQIPEDKCVRLLFQPAEEGGNGGAKPMIEEGCLDGADEVYGFHNMPQIKEGIIAVKEGPMMAEGTLIKINIIGKGGHGSQPEKCNDPLQPAIDLHVKLRDIISDFKTKGVLFSCTLPVLQVGEADNVIAETGHIAGTLRCFESAFTGVFKEALVKLLDEVTNRYNCKYELNYWTYYPVVLNSKAEADNVFRVASKAFGEGSVTKEDLPIYASEDFSFYLQNKRGAFFFIGTKKENQQDPLSLHNNHYDFNDDIIEKAATMWLKLIEDRFDISFN
jgi:hippurate hydrolase